MTKEIYNKRTGRIYNILHRSHEERMTYFDDDELFDKPLTVYGESKMIEIKKSYVLELTEQQARELYDVLRTAKENGRLTIDHELVLVLNELKPIFDSGIR
jgi:hypothetical protein